MRHNPVAGALVVMLRGLRLSGMAQIAAELTEHAAPAFEAAIPVLSRFPGRSTRPHTTHFAEEPNS